MSFVLIVERSEPVRSEIAALLGFRGMQPIAVSGERAATLLTERFRPDLVLLDCSAPDDCLPPLNHLRSLPCATAVPVITYSGEADVRIRERALASGAVEYISRGSVQWARLADRVKEHLVRAAVARERARRGRRAAGEPRATSP